MADTTPINVNFYEYSKSDHYTKWLESKSDRYKLYREKWNNNPKNYINEGYPINLDIESSSACNLRCPMCPRTKAVNEKGKLDRQSQHFDFDLYKRLIDEAADIGVYALKLNWLGEPLMNPRIVDMVRYAKEKGIEDVQMNTNAVLLSEKMSRELISAGLDGLFISFDSPYKEAYEKIRIGANYESVLANIIRFHEIRAEMKSMNPVTRISMIKMSEDDGSVEAFIELFRDVVDVVVFYNLIDNDKDYSAILKEYKDASISCQSPWQRIAINTDGKIAVCCHDRNADFGIGNIRDMTIKEAWNSEKFNELRKLHENKRWHEYELCAKCPLMLVAITGHA